MPPSHPKFSKAFHQRLEFAEFIGRYFWIIIKNIIGWLLILTAIPIGGLFPGPLGMPIFLIGFALITFPGKRRLTSRLLRGIPYNLYTPRERIIRLAIALVLPPPVIWFVSHRKYSLMHPMRIGLSTSIILYILGFAGMWIVVLWLGRLMNLFIRLLPRVRRSIRPWLKRHGVNLLPPRQKRRNLKLAQPGGEDEILEIQRPTAEQVGRARHKLRLLLAVGVTALILVWMFKPIVRRWPDVHDRVMHTSLPRFLLASLMFASFLLVFRVVSWRKIIGAFGHSLPLAAAARIWSISELARYIPGVIWQVVGRAYLVRPYGISAAASSTSQVLELSIFLLANLLLALACLPWYAAGISGASHQWFIFATGLAPLLLILLHPKIFYGAINSILTRLKKPRVECRLGGAGLLGLLFWAVLGLCWQGLAIWLLVAQPHALDLGLDGLVLVIGAYCLAWCAGFLAFWAPGGIGVREVVLVATLKFALPPHFHNEFHSEGAFKLFLSFLSVLLRLWTIVGELILCGVAHAFDYRGALGRPDAPGRTGLTPTGGTKFIDPSQQATPALPPGVAGDTLS
jgi:glycosyltransferase 2 family protein